MEPHAILEWWSGARAFFQEHMLTAVAQIDNEATRLSNLLKRDEEIVVCVLGQAAVGKSTLLNAIVAGSESVLPAGGIGPLTALATKVRYSNEPYFVVRYQDLRQLQGVRLAIEGELARQGKFVPPSLAEAMGGAEGEDIFAILEAPIPVKTASMTAGMSKPITLEVEDSEDSQERLGAHDERQKRIEELLKQVRQIVKGDQFAQADIVELVAGFRRVLGLQSDHLPRLTDEDEARVRQAAIALASGRSGTSVRRSKAELGTAFMRELRQHASGSLAPLVADIEVGWPSEVLRGGLILVDLPGIGVASDRYRTVTSDFVRQRARAVILVVDRAGPTDASVDLLRESGYWDRLLLSSDDPDSDPCSLILAVSRIDDVAEEEHRLNNDLPKEDRPKRWQVFVRVKDQIEEKMRVQAASCFTKLSEGVADDQAIRTARTEASRTLLDSLRVFPVSAPEYRKLLDDDDGRSFLQDVSQTGLPALQACLSGLAASHRESLSNARNEVGARLLRTASATLDQLHGQWSENQRAAEEAVRLRGELDRFLEPKRIELANREGGFREFLELTAGSRIDELVAKAQVAAQQEVSSYLGILRNLHWATLRATVVRGGTFVSGVHRRIDLTADVAQLFQEPMAAVWGQTLLKDVRTRTQRHGRSIEQIVDDICECAGERSDTHTQRLALVAQQELIRDRVKQLGQVGREAADELKDAVKRELMESISGPIRASCERFVESGDAYGPGVKYRIVSLFDQLASQAVAAAASPAAKLLKGRFSEVQIEILRALAEWGDPIQQAADAVVEREEIRIRRSDAQRRSRVLVELEGFRQDMPKPTPEPLAQVI